MLFLLTVRYSALDASKLINPQKGILECERCFFELRQEDNTSRVTELQNKKSTMLTQLKPITEQLKRTERIVIPLYGIYLFSLITSQDLRARTYKTRYSIRQQ